MRWLIVLAPWCVYGLLMLILYLTGPSRCE